MKVAVVAVAVATGVIGWRIVPLLVSQTHHAQIGGAAV
jgi:hypothetical protein